MSTERQILTKGGTVPFGIKDVLAGVGTATMTGQPLTAIPAIAASRALGSPATQEMLGKGVQSGGKLLSKIPESLSNTMTKASPALQYMGRNIPFTETGGEEGVLPELPSGFLQGQTGGFQPQGQTGTISQASPDPTMQRQNIAKLMIKYPKYASQIKAAYEMYAGGGTTKQTPQVLDLQSSEALARQLKGQMASYKDVMGPAKGRLRGFNPYDPKAQKFNSLMTAVAQVIGKAMEGGVLRQEDVKKYRVILPNIQDTYQTAQDKIDNVIMLLQGQIQGRSSQAIPSSPAGLFGRTE